ncbi:MAG: 50S ribosomal protein L3 [Candidatus Omnitrophica bacterium]|nr:50S ribosomal protein L3 [Candidatus Omnitrophota bacterium]MCM8802677.1 50S ribosomal protein L3 [Candidatus Omnitrophota bacterium]
MGIGIVGKKLKMTQIFKEDGEVIPVTLIEYKEGYVVDLKTIEKDGYYAVKVGFEQVDEKKLTKPEIGYFKKRNLPLLKILKEFRVNGEEIKNFKIGDKISIDIFKEGDYIDVTGNSIGKGFQGVVKRHGFHGGPATHGSMSHRAPGSIGSTAPQRVLKGRRMAGHMGSQKVTIQNLKIIKILNDENLIMVKGAVPGPSNSYLILKKAIKKKVKNG